MQILILALLIAGLGAARAAADGEEPIVTVVADFENDALAVRLGDVTNVAARDCAVRWESIPARAQNSLGVAIGATAPNSSVVCELLFRLTTTFESAERVAAYAWVNEGSARVAFRVRDSENRVFETTSAVIDAPNRWVRLVADLKAESLRPAGAAQQATGGEPATAPALVWPIEVVGVRVAPDGVGRKQVFLDDIEVEHRVPPTRGIRGEFELDRPTHLYEPETDVRAGLVLENLSRSRRLDLDVQVSWLRADGSEVHASRSNLTLPPSGADYRARQRVDFSYRVPEPGLYRLVARARAAAWRGPAVFETTVAALVSNRGLPRGRARFFAVRSQLLREPRADQILEIDVARELGVQLLALDLPWQLIEPQRGAPDFAQVERVVEAANKRDMAVLLALSEPPAWAVAEGATLVAQGHLLEAAAKRLGARVALYQPMMPLGGAAPDAAALEALQSRIVAAHGGARVVAPPGAAAIAARADAGPYAALATEASGASATAQVRDRLVVGDAANSGVFWSHRLPAQLEAGEVRDAVDMLRQYVSAAEFRVAGLILEDLRDATSDPRYPERHRGLLRRDFSPKAQALGFATAVGMLSGLLYHGPLADAPPEFNTALFMGGERQVGVLFPKNDRALPAFISPFTSVDATVLATDFARRPAPLFEGAGGWLTPAEERPLFLELRFERAEGEPRLGLDRPWLRLPRLLPVGRAATAVPLEIDAPVALRNSFLQVLIPKGAPLTANVSTRKLQGEAGQTIAPELTLTPSGAGLREPVTLTLRVSIEGQALDVPLRLTPLIGVPAAESGPPREQVGELRVLRGDRGPARTALRAAFSADRLTLALPLPADLAPGAVWRIELAPLGAERLEATVSDLAGAPRIAWRVPPTDSATSQVQTVDAPGGRACVLSLSARSLGAARLAAGMQFRLAAELSEPRGPGLAPQVSAWGRVEAGGQAADYQWVELGAK